MSCEDCNNLTNGICCHAAMRDKSELVGSDEAISAGVKHIELLNRINERKARIAENERKAHSKLAQEQAWADELERITKFKASLLFASMVFVPILIIILTLIQIGSRG